MLSIGVGEAAGIRVGKKVNNVARSASQLSDPLVLRDA